MYLKNYWADFHDSKAIWQPLGHTWICTGMVVLSLDHKKGHKNGQNRVEDTSPEFCQPLGLDHVSERYVFVQFLVGSDNCLAPDADMSLSLNELTKPFLQIRISSHRDQAYLGRDAWSDRDLTFTMSWEHVKHLVCHLYYRGEGGVSKRLMSY